MPANTVYVGRGSRWGNPFRVVQYSDGKWAIKTDGSDRCNELLTHYCHAVYDTKATAAIDAVECYKKWLLPYTVAELKGKNLACWCALHKPCHADYLLEVANED